MIYLHNVDLATLLSPFFAVALRVMAVSPNNEEMQATALKGGGGIS